MTFFYLFLIVHLIFGLVCAYLVKSSGLKPESWFLTGALLGGLGLCLCWLRVIDPKRNANLSEAL